jgi:hypothetical protein
VVSSLRRTVALAAAALAVALCGLPAGNGQAVVGGTWMAGPGCGGGYEWLQHPRELPYFCDGTAVLEDARWRDWGKPQARASATLDEALLGAHDNPANAPRQRTPVTIVASHVKRCGGRRAYTSVVIHLSEDRGGPRTLRLASLLPPCRRLGAQPAPPKAAEFYARPAGGLISCGMYADQVICQSSALVSAGTGTTQWVARMNADGRVSRCSQALSDGQDPCRAGNVGEGAPTYAPGKRVVVGPFTCEVLASGVECTLSASGKGFLIEPDAIAPVGS